jgi:hypothetical protein
MFFTPIYSKDILSLKTKKSKKKFFLNFLNFICDSAAEISAD